MQNSFFTNFQLDSDALLERLTTVGGSDVNILASGDHEKITKLYRQKRQEIDPDDLSTVWPVLMGHITEEVNLEWVQLKHQVEIINRQRVLYGKGQPRMRCTIDGSIDDYKGQQAVIDAKFTMGRPFAGEDWKDVIPRLCRHYSPQLHWNAYLIEENTGRPCPMGLLSIIRAGAEPTLHEFVIDPNYQQELIGLATYFLGCLDMGIPPDDIAPQEAPVPQEDTIPVDMSETDQSAEWERLAGVYTQTVGAAEACKEAESKIKKLVPVNASVAFGHGIQVKVAKNRAKRIEVMK